MNTYFVFSTTNLVFLSEDLLNKNSIECEIIPTPKTDRVCCGICISINKEDLEKTKKMFNENYIEWLDSGTKK